MQAYFAHTDGEKFADVAARGAVLTLAADLCRRFGTTDFAEDNSADVVKQVIRIIRKHLTESLTLDDLADRVGISKYHLTRQFRRYTGSTVITFLNRTRCDHARHLLLTEQCTVGEAAELSGFSNLSYFTRTFRRHIGCLPSECRRE